MHTQTQRDRPPRELRIVRRFMAEWRAEKRADLASVEADLRPALGALLPAERVAAAANLSRIQLAHGHTPECLDHPLEELRLAAIEAVEVAARAQRCPPAALSAALALADDFTMQVRAAAERLRSVVTEATDLAEPGPANRRGTSPRAGPSRARPSTR